MKHQIFIIIIKILIIMGLFSLFGCNEKTFVEDKNFSKKTERYKIKISEAEKIYEKEFDDNFLIHRDSNFNKQFLKIMYLKNDMYFIGYTPMNDMRGRYSPHIKYLVRINPETGKTHVIN